MVPMEETCCFTGHRPAFFSFKNDESHPECGRIKAFIRERCEYCVTRKGVRHFISGGALGVDTWAMEAVIDLKAAYPTVTLECALPFAGMPAGFPPDDRYRYHRLVDQIDTVTVIAPRYGPGCMRQRNQYMVDRAAFLIAVWTGRKSGTGQTVAYAQRRGRTVYRLNPDDPAAMA
ncbi:MAG: DUF1273 domain-containing protein [Planctomycetes bacterium]|nr:DUF1273 domain-containing protein [Planctomycetota bacterium]